MYSQKVDSLGYILAADSIDALTMHFNATGPQSSRHYAVQGHSRSPILVPIKRTYASFLLVKNTILTSYLAPFPIYCGLQGRRSVAKTGGVQMRTPARYA